MKPLYGLVLAAAISALPGCGASCEDYCRHMDECLTAMGQTTLLTIEQCTSGCENTRTFRESSQDHMDCAVDVECEGRSAEEISADFERCAREDLGDR